MKKTITILFLLTVSSFCLLRVEGIQAADTETMPRASGVGVKQSPSFGLGFKHGIKLPFKIVGMAKYEFAPLPYWQGGYGAGFVIALVLWSSIFKCIILPLLNFRKTTNT